MERGFALVITLSLMVLLTVLAVGLLSLSSVSLRSASHSDAMAAARANARMALSLAIGELQKLTGPDRRITTAADQLKASEQGEESAAAAGKRHWTGVYRSWDAATTARPEPEFLSWLVSSPDREHRSEDLAKSASGGTDSVRLVGDGTLGPDAIGAVDAPLVATETAQGLGGRFAWWIGDQGVKAAIASPPVEETESPAFVRQTLQGSPRHAVELAATAEGAQPFAEVNAGTADLAKVTSWRQAEHLAGSPAEARPLFHDLAPWSSGLLTNVRAGGFRKDLSMHLERDRARAPKEPLYRVGGKEGINMAELWLHYHMGKELKTGGRNSYTTGGAIPSKARYLQVEGTMQAMLSDPEHFYKQPALIAYHTVVSLHVRGNGRLAIVIDPIVTYWNPLDVPVVLSPAYNSIKFWQLPYDLKLNIGSRTINTSLRTVLSGSAWHYLTLIAGRDQPIVMRPGEVLMVSQGPDSTIQPYNPGLNYIGGRAGWNFGGGVALEVRDTAGTYVQVAPNETVRYELRPNADVCNGTRHWSLNHHETYYKEDRKDRGESVGIGGIYIDSIFGQPHGESNPKPASSRLLASSRSDFFGKIRPQDTRPLSATQLAGRKEPLMMFSYVAKTEFGTERGAGRYFQRFNPKAMNVDFYDLSEREFDMLPFEIQIQPLNSWKNRNLEVSPRGNGYFGGGMNAEFGSSVVSTHSVPREPIYSLAALQHAFANGFSSNNPQDGYSVINARYGMLPQVSHPIGNSIAPSVIPSDRTETTLPGGPRVLADHAYLANRALWDDWFFSGITPQTTAGFAKSRSQRQVADDFFQAKAPLPVVRYLPDTRETEVETMVSSMFSGSSPAPAATALIASLLRVDGMFNVNSTSVEAWKAVLAGLKDRPVMIRDANGGEEIAAADGSTPVAGLIAPEDRVVDGDGQVDVKEPAQWIGRRTLDDAEIDALARAIVREVRKRGPFLSLADFINRRVGNDKELARAGAIQAALDSKEVAINRAWNEGDRAVAGQASARMAFPEAEDGPAAAGIPGIVKQADILTPIAPVLSARSDSFVIRTYGEAVGADGKVLARAWCEAVVEREKEFIDTTDKADAAVTSLNPVNKTFGRRYQVRSFRWLGAGEV